jgi:hypothetical protein
LARFRPASRSRDSSSRTTKRLFSTAILAPTYTAARGRITVALHARALLATMITTGAKARRGAAAPAWNAASARREARMGSPEARAIPTPGRT